MADSPKHTPEENEPPTCVKCGDEYLLPDGYDRTDYCDPCAQELVPELLEALQDAHTHFIGMAAYLATCSTEVIVENLETTIAALHNKAEAAEAAIRNARGE